jgi:hypothetical protein
MTSLKDINDIHNGLLLYKPVEWAFDSGKLCIGVKSKDDMIFHFLDENLSNVKIADKAAEIRVGKQKKQSKKIKVDLEGSHVEIKGHFGIEKDLHTTFGDLDGSQVKFPKGVTMRPSKRLLALHAAKAIFESKQFISIEFDISDDELANREVKSLLYVKHQGVSVSYPFMEYRF